MVNKKTKPIDDEIVEMGAGKDGVYYPVAVVKEGNRSVARNDAVHDMPRWIPPIYEMLNGFVMGLGAIENFMINVKKIDKRSRK